MPSPLTLVLAALGAGWAIARRLRGRPDPSAVLAQVERVLPDGARVVDVDGVPIVRAIVRGVQVDFRAGLPRSGQPDWSSGLGATARYVLDGGPRFHTDARDAALHLQTARGWTQPLRMLYPHAIPLVGEHVEARPLVQAAFLSIEPTDALSAPFISSDGHEVSAWLAFPPTPEASAAVISRLATFVATLARHRADVLDDYAEAIDAVVRISPAERPALAAHVDLGDERAIRLEARFLRQPTPLVGARELAVRASAPSRITLPRERLPISRLPDADRLVPEGLAARAPRALVRGEDGEAIIEWAHPPSVPELVAAVELLHVLAPPRSDLGPFR